MKGTTQQSALKPLAQLAQIAQPSRFDTTLKMLHELYQEAFQQSEDLLGIVENYYSAVMQNKNNVPQEERTLLYEFLDGLKGCLNYRQKTFAIMNTVTYIDIALLYIIIWLMNNGSQMDVFLIARRKALESDLFKILKKSLKNDYLIKTGCSTSTELSSNIRDRFGFLFIVNNKEKSNDYIYEIYNLIILGILCGKNHEMKDNFISWITTHPRIPKLEKDMVLNVLDIPFAFEHLKDFIKSPKSNGYQTLQGTLRIEMYSDILPGCMMEIQIRDSEMHRVAVSGSASHVDYKVEFNEPEFEGINLKKLVNVFTVDHPETTHISGLTRYEKKPLSTDDLLEVTRLDDADGILCPKVFVFRHISPHLVKKDLL